MSIIIGADIVPVESNQELFRAGQLEDLIGRELINLLSKSDYKIFNLEVPLTDIQQPIEKYGPHLIASVDTVVGIKKMGINLLTLANNHIMDQGSQGLFSTIQALDKVGISYVGAGRNVIEAQEAFYVKINGKKYGIYACAEHEFSIARNNRPGANPFDPMDSLDHVSRMKSECDYAIILYHGGKEHYRYPSPNLQKTCRKLVEKGADLVICQHSHCIGCKEEYSHGTIVYGQGNFLFNKRSNEYWNTGLLIHIDDFGKITYIPITRQEYGVKLAEGRDAERIIESFKKRSEEIKQPGFVEEKYKAFTNELISGYALLFLGIRNGILFRIFNKLTGQRLRRKTSQYFQKKKGLMLRTFIGCESHREVLLEGLEQEDDM